MGIGFQNVEDTVRSIETQHACWVCGAVPELYDARTFGSAGPEYIAGTWPVPASDHLHVNNPPTPEQLEAAGHAALRRILEG